MKRVYAWLTSLALLLTLLPLGAVSVSAATTGTTGDCTWTFSDGVLTISGNGKMENYYDVDDEHVLVTPWKNLNVVSVIIEEGVTNIGKAAFYNCSSLTSITIPSSVTYIGAWAIVGCSNLNAVHISDLAAWCKIDFFDYFDVWVDDFPSCTNPLQRAKNLYLNGELVTDLVIPEGATTIAAGAFQGCTSLTSVTIPKSITRIENGSFAGCTNIKSVYIQDLAAWCQISFGAGPQEFWDGGNPLEYAQYLYVEGKLIQDTDLVIPEGVTAIGREAFYGCDCLTSVILPSTVTTIGYSAFYNCNNLNSVSFGAGVTTIDSDAFSFCKNLSDVWYGGTKEMRDKISIKESDWGNKSYLLKATWHYNAIPNHTHTYTNMCDTTCNICGEIREVPHSYAGDCHTTCTICGAVRETNNHVWEKGFCSACGKASPSKVKIITQPSVAVAKIGVHARTKVVAEGEGLIYQWYVCDEGKTEYVISVNKTASYSVKVTEANHNRKIYCEITDVYGNTVTSEITTVRIAATIVEESDAIVCAPMGEEVSVTVKALGEGLTYAWYYKNAGASKYYKSSVSSATYSVVMSDETKDRLVYCVVKDQYGKSAQSKTYQLFEGESGTTGDCVWSLVDGVLTISGNGAMGDYQDYGTPWGNTISSVVIEEGVTTIGDYAFYKCLNLTSITIPDSITCIGEEAFGSCTGLSAVYITDLTAWCGIDFDLVHHENAGDDEWHTCGNPLSFAEKLYVNGELVTTLVIPNGLTEIKDGAFFKCKSLISLIIPSSVVSIGDCAFDYCNYLENVWYGGSKEEIKIGISDVGAENLDIATWHYNALIEDGHVYDNVCDESCDACGFFRKVSGHVWKEGVCSTCGSASPTKVTITTQPKTTYGKLGDTVSITVEAQGDDLQYQWYTKDTTQDRYYRSKIVEKTYTIEVKENNHNRLMYCKVFDTYGNVVKSTTVRLRMAASIVEEPATVAYAKKGATAKVQISAKGDGLTYQWYYKNESGKVYSKSSITTDTYTVAMSDKVKGRRIYCVVTDKYGKKVQSKTFLLRESVSITQEPAAAYAAMGATVKVAIAASGDGLKYQWYYKNASGKVYSKSSITTNTYTVAMSDKVEGRRIYCVVTDKYGKKVQSKTFILREGGVVITKEPSTATYAKKGASAKVTITAAGDGLTYTWYVKDAGATKYTKSSIKTNTYSVKMSDKVNGRRLYCIVTDQYGNTVQSKTMILKMK